MRVSRFIPLFVSALTLAACKGGGGSAGGAVPLKTDDDKSLYAVGIMSGQQTARFHFTPEQVEVIKEGFADAAAGRTPQVDMQAYAIKASDMLRQKMEEESKTATAEAAARKEKEKPFLDAAAKENGAQTLDKGVVYLSETEGKGDSPKPTDYIQVNYSGKLTDGTEFDASSKHGGPAKFFLNRVVPCWTIGVQKMKVGGKAKLTCPSDAAYGDRGQPPQIPGGSTLVFEVELISIEQPPAMGGLMMPNGQKIPMPTNPASKGAAATAAPAATKAASK